MREARVGSSSTGKRLLNTSPFLWEVLHPVLGTSAAIFHVLLCYSRNWGFTTLNLKLNVFSIRTQHSQGLYCTSFSMTMLSLLMMLLFFFFFSCYSIYTSRLVYIFILRYMLYMLMYTCIYITVFKQLILVYILGVTHLFTFFTFVDCPFVLVCFQPK